MDPVILKIMSGLGIIGHANNMYGRKTVIGIVK